MQTHTGGGCNSERPATSCHQRTSAILGGYITSTRPDKGRFDEWGCGGWERGNCPDPNGYALDTHITTITITIDSNEYMSVVRSHEATTHKHTLTQRGLGRREVHRFVICLTARLHASTCMRYALCVCVRIAVVSALCVCAHVLSSGHCTFSEVVETGPVSARATRMCTFRQPPHLTF